MSAIIIGITNSDVAAAPESKSTFLQIRTVGLLIASCLGMASILSVY